jgi:threonine synthase
MGLADLVDAGTSVRTPTVRLGRHERELGVAGVYVKDETGQPSGSTKDRCAALVLAAFRATGVTRFAASSTGNTARALSMAVARDHRMSAHFFLGSGFPLPPTFGADERVFCSSVAGSYSDAMREAARAAAGEEWTLEGGFANWARREGAKLAYLEAYLDMAAPPDVVVQAVSSGLGLLGADKASRELTASGILGCEPRYVVVQEDTCAPIVSAWSNGRSELAESDVVRNPSGLATAILHGDPRASYPYLRRLVDSTGGRMVAVTAQAIIEARRTLAEDTGIDACFASAAALAGLVQLAHQGHVGQRDTVLVKIGGRFQGAGDGVGQAHGV